MLDNFHPQHIRETIELLESKELRERILIEASGGITEANILEFAGTGVDIISLGELTHTTKALDISLDIQESRKR
jgi:nicotinate-nucleotide pyrophosphorylase (carboxylating)